MPHSRQRHKHPDHQVQHHVVKPESKRNAATIFAIIIGIFGLVIGAFASDTDMLWMILSAAVGVIAGYMIGRAIDKTTAGK